MELNKIDVVFVWDKVYTIIGTYYPHYTESVQLIIP
jgi:hypothetical protein